MAVVGDLDSLDVVLLDSYRRAAASTSVSLSGLSRKLAHHIKLKTSLGIVFRRQLLAALLLAGNNLSNASNEATCLWGARPSTLQNCRSLLPQASDSSPYAYYPSSNRHPYLSPRKAFQMT